MVALQLLGRFQFYSTKERAQIEGARFIQKHLSDRFMKKGDPNLRLFQDAYSQERYGDCLDIWNKVLDNDNHVLGNPFYKAIVMDAVIDAPFW